MKAKTDNGWYNIDDKQPENNQKVYVIFESGNIEDGSYHCSIGISTYYCDEPRYHYNGHFEGEDYMFSIKYWREIIEFPYPSEIEQKLNKKYDTSIIPIIKQQKKHSTDVVINKQRRK